MSARIYLDHAATTPMQAEARLAMVQALEAWANPSSPHAEGRTAKAALEQARARIKAALGWPGALIFTSSASEAAGIAARLVKHPTHFVSAVEHDALRRAMPGATILPVDRSGIVQLNEIKPKSMIAVQTVNSETGVIQPLNIIAERTKEAGGLWLADAAQSAGKIPLPDADLVIVSAHKLGGPPGASALLVKDLAVLSPTGGQEQGYRAGTENLPAILGFAAAVEARPARDHLPGLRAYLDDIVREIGGEIMAEDSMRLPEIASYRLPGVAAAAQLIELDAAGISVSAGSACSSGSLRPSAVLTAMGWDETAAREVIRVSFGPQTSRAEVDRFLEIWRRLAKRRRAA
jgi:cysteine desulfurase